MDYQQFTEGAGKTSASGSRGALNDCFATRCQAAAPRLCGEGPKDGLQKVDPDSGVGPRRCTDLVC